MNPLDIVSIVTGLGKDVLDKLWPDPAQQAQAKITLLEAQQKGELDAVAQQLSSIIAEAKSADPWTSRARPSFMYVIYLLILMALPMAVVAAFNPALSVAIINGFHQWLAAIPDSYLQLFGVGYLGYTGARSFEKLKGVSNA